MGKTTRKDFVVHDFAYFLDKPRAQRRATSEACPQGEQSGSIYRISENNFACVANPAYLRLCVNS